MAIYQKYWSLNPSKLIICWNKCCSLFIRRSPVNIAYASNDGMPGMCSHTKTLHLFWLHPTLCVGWSCKHKCCCILSSGTFSGYTNKSMWECIVGFGQCLYFQWLFCFYLINYGGSILIPTIQQEARSNKSDIYHSPTCIIIKYTCRHT